MASSYDWPRVAYRRALIGAGSAIVITVLALLAYSRGYRGLDWSWIIPAAPVLVYQAFVVFRQGRAMRDGDIHAARALTTITAVKAAGWLGLIIFAWPRPALLVLGVIMLALKVGELGIYLRTVKYLKREHRHTEA